MVFPTIDAALVRRLISEQFAEWADLAVVQVIPGGWDNRTFRLGPSLSVRLPSAEGYATAVAKEQRYLPLLAPHLPLPIPTPVGAGRPTHYFPWNWSVLEWLPGETVEQGGVRSPDELAADIAGFLRALQAVDAAGGPMAGAHSFFRGADPAHYDSEVREAIETLGSSIDGARATALWDEGVAARWTGEPVWFHGDVSSGNLLATSGRLSAVIDFGTSGVGDPACDLYIAWTYLEEGSRRVFRNELGADDAMWARGRAWALWKALIMLRDGREEARRAYDEIML